MRTTHFIGIFFSIFALGCSASVTTNGSSSGASDTDAGEDAGTAEDAGSGDTGASAVPTYSELYANYFGPGTAGHCGNAGCHATSQDGFACGASAKTCYEGMVTKGIINAQSPSSSSIANPSLSILIWIDPKNGSMPEDELKSNTQAAADIKAWVEAGALDN